MFADQSVDNEVPLQPMQLLLQACGDEASVTQPVVQLPSASGSGVDVEDDLRAGPILFMLPGLEGMAITLEPLGRNLKSLLLLVPLLLLLYCSTCTIL
jgi:hypothetical protein